MRGTVVLDGVLFTLSSWGIWYGEDGSQFDDSTMQARIKKWS